MFLAIRHSKRAHGKGVTRIKPVDAARKIHWNNRLGSRKLSPGNRCQPCLAAALYCRRVKNTPGTEGADAEPEKRLPTSRKSRVTKPHFTGATCWHLKGDTAITIQAWFIITDHNLPAPGIENFQQGIQPGSQSSCPDIQRQGRSLFCIQLKRANRLALKMALDSLPNCQYLALLLIIRLGRGR